MSRDRIETSNGEQGWESIIKNGSVAHLGQEGN